MKRVNVIRHRSNAISYLGLILVISGLYFLAEYYGWIPKFPIWPILLVAFGIAILVNQLWRAR